MTIKVKEITIGGGGKISREYQSQEYPVSVTVIVEEGDKPSKAIEKAIKLLIVARLKAYEVAEEELERLILLKRESEMAEIHSAYKETVKATKKEPPVRKAEPQFKEEKLIVTEEKTITTEEVLMDPNEVTIMAKTDLSLLVTKKGYQKWIPFSLMPDISKDDYNKGEYIEKIVIKEDKRKWFNEVKGWDKLEVRKS